jgi:Bacterial Ig domain
MSPRNRLLLVVSLALTALCFGMPGFSGATFTAASTNPAATVTAASDWTPPTVSVTNPGSTLSGTTTITATATDANSGVATVLLQYAAAGSSTWTDLCSARTTAPYSCSWVTTAITDGDYQLRATATDVAGYSTTSAVVSTTVLNSAKVTLTDPGDNLRGSVPLSATLAGYGTQTITSVRIEYSVADANSWTTLCSGTTATLSCTWNTGTLADFYDIRANATVGGKNYLDLAQGVTVDNLAPTGTITSPTKNAVVSGTITLATNAADPISGIGSVVVQYAPTGTTGWLTACTITVSPYSCRFDTTKITDRGYDLRAIITDQAGNSLTAPTVTGVTVSNTVPTVSIEMPLPSAYVSGTVPVTANASSTAGVTNVSIQARTGNAAFVEVCSVTTSPYTCNWNTGTVTGVYDLRAVMTDRLNVVTTSTTVSVNVDNSPLRAYDVQTTNSTTGTAGRLNAGDRIVLTYSNQVNLTTVLAGWTGAATTVSARVVDGSVVGGANTDDTFSVDGVNLGTVDLQGNLVRKKVTAMIASSTMTASTTTVNGATATVVTITLGTPSGSLATSNTLGTMRWVPSATAKSPLGVAVSTTPASESGAADRDF